MKHSRSATILVLLFFAGAFLSRCASIGTPTGGPKDTLPPVVVAVVPEDGATNFKSKSIYIEFDEYVQLKDQQKEIYVSPAMGKKPVFTMRGRGIYIQIKDDSLLPETTYAIEFGSSVADNNESNALHGLRYVFSTGSAIDSLICSGYTEDSYTADSLGKSFIWFYEADSVETPDTYDSTIFKYKPSKIARSQNNGIFIAQNLKPVPYRVYAIFDANDNQTYEPSIDKVGFVDGVYNPAEMPDFSIWYDSVRRYPSADPQLYFRLFTDVSFRRQSLQEATRPEQHKVVLSFGASNPDIRSLRLDSVQQDKIIVEPLSKGRDTLALWLNVPSESLPDTLRGEIVFMAHDTLNVLRETKEELKLSWRRIESRDQERERERNERARAKAEAAGEEWKETPTPSTFAMIDFAKSAEVNPEQDLPLEFATPLTRFDSTAVELLSFGEGGDTLRERAIFIPDTANVRRWRLRSRWLPDRQYRLRIPPDALADITGEGNDSITASLTVSKVEDYATLRLKVTPRHEGDLYILQLVDVNGTLLREERGVGAGEHTMLYVPAGDMRLRIIEDVNGNGEWDGGNLVERRQSERAEFYKNDEQEELFTTKTGWEFDLTLDMNRIFAPVTMDELVRRLDQREQTRLRKEAERRAKEGKRDNGQNNQQQSGSGLNMGGMGGLGGITGNMF
ncbi:MAG TPA: Ig-like domain-containing protein [Candidatus Alistipes merdipullorum]|nr:Ig-like domain-containing protein [Candidatus Alistipes merdipullorum]